MTQTLIANPPQNPTSPGSERPAVEVRDLRKTYANGVEAVRGIDFEIATGEVFGLLGPNGAGKSTTIGMLTTTIAPTGGTASVAGVDVAQHPLATRAVSGVVFQDSVVDRPLSGRRNLMTHARIWGVSPAAAGAVVSSLAPAFGIVDILDRPVATYSGGQRRRLEILRALVTEPSVLFLDEPTVGLDPRIRVELLEIIAMLRDRARMTIVLTTHYLDEAERLCDRIAIMHAGRIVALDSPASLLAGLGNEIVELHVHGSPDEALRTLRRDGVADQDAFAVGSTLTIPIRGRAGVEAMAAIQAAGVATAAVSTRQPTLDDVYLQLTGDRLAA
ncbi:MAG: ABC transporter ATP-binding protein [Candidatus Dormiibacterota bacterium]